MKPHAVEPLALRPAQAARVLGISLRTLWAWTQPRGPIPCLRIGSGKRQTVLYSVDALKAWLNQKANESAGQQAAERCPLTGTEDRPNDH